MSDDTPPATTPEREVFRYTSPDRTYVRVLVAGPVDDDVCEMLEGYITRQRAQLCVEEMRKCPIIQPPMKAVT